MKNKRMIETTSTGKENSRFIHFPRKATPISSRTENHTRPNQVTRMHTYQTSVEKMPAHVADVLPPLS